MKRRNISSGAKWEDIVGYSRAVVMGDTLEVTGTVALGDNGVEAKGDFYGQTKFIIQKVEKIMKEAGFALADVVRTRIFVTDITQWENVGKAHGEFFKSIRPATTMVQISALIDPDYLVEIEFTAVRQTS